MLQKEKETLTKLVQKFKTQEVYYYYLQLSYLFLFIKTQEYYYASALA